MMKKVSVVIPFYSGREWLSFSIDSILNQTYNNIEVILVNDGSEEDLSDFLDIYGSKIKYFIQENKGAAAARNLAIANSTGDYIAFMDADDYWMPEKAEKQIAFMENNGCKWSNTGYYNWFPDENKEELVDNQLTYGNIFLQTLTSIRISTPSVIISRECFDNIPDLRFPENMRKGQDTALYSKISQYYPLGLLKSPLMKVRMRRDNSFKNALARFRMKNQLKEFVDFSNHKIPCIIKLIYSFYSFYDWIYGTLLGIKPSSKHQTVAKLLWAIPYFLERVCLKTIIKKADEESKYIR